MRCWKSCRACLCLVPLGCALLEVLQGVSESGSFGLCAVGSPAGCVWVWFLWALCCWKSCRMCLGLVPLDCALLEVLQCVSRSGSFGLCTRGEGGRGVLQYVGWDLVPLSYVQETGQLDIGQGPVREYS